MEKKEKIEKVSLWDLEIEELTGHNIEAKGRDEVNEKLQSGWILLHLYTLTYKENGSWRERPMAILGRPKKAGVVKEKNRVKEKGTFVSV